MRELVVAIIWKLWDLKGEVDALRSYPSRGPIPTTGAMGLSRSFCGQRRSRTGTLIMLNNLGSSLQENGSRARKFPPFPSSISRRWSFQIHTRIEPG